MPLSSFYWRDTLPGQMTLNQIVTGTYNQQLSYKVVYKTNLSGSSYRTLADNLSTSKNYVLDARPAILKLASNERITEVMFVFGRGQGWLCTGRNTLHQRHRCKGIVQRKQPCQCG